MKGPFSFWAFFGLTLWIDIISHLVVPKKEKRINPYNPVREVSVLIPVHMEPYDYIKKTIDGVYMERYPIKNIIICSDIKSPDYFHELSDYYDNVYLCESPYQSKAKKINYAISTMQDILGEFIYVRDCRVTGNAECVERMMSYFHNDKVAAVTSYGRVSIPKNFLSRSYFYGKAWINEIGRFRKNAQEKRKAVFVICGASTIYRLKVLKSIPIPGKSKTEDTNYTWLLQKKGFDIRVADDATVSAPEVDGEGFSGIKGQIKQSYRWSSGTVQCLYIEGSSLFKNKRLVYTTIIPGLLESIMYAIPLILLPLLFYFLPYYGLGFLIGDTVFSLIGTLIIIPRKFVKTVIHYPQIFFFKYLNALIFLWALIVVTTQAIFGLDNKWSNVWSPPKTSYKE